MTPVIFTYGHIDAMFYTLQGIAMVLRHEWVKSILYSIMFLGFFFSCLKIAYSRIDGLKVTGLRFLVSMVVFVAFLSKGPTVTVYDRVTRQAENIDNLPWGFIAPVSLIEIIGAEFTDIFEQAFAPVESFKFTNYGMVFGASLVQELRNIKIANPVVIHNFNNITQRCLIPAITVSGSLSAEEIFRSDDILKDLKAVYHAEGLRQALIWQGEERSLLSCHSAIKVLESQFNREEKNIVSKYANTIFNRAGGGGELIPRRSPQLGNFFKTNLENVFGHYLGSSVSSASEHLKQLMMMHSFSTFKGYANVRSIQQQESAWKTAGELSNYYLPMFLTIMKCLSYAAFVFILPMMLVSGNFVLYKKYLLGVVSFQIWPALYSVLNMIVELYSASRMQDLAAGAVSLATFSEIGACADKITAVVAGIQFLVPYLAYLITQGSFEGMVHLSQGLTGTFQGTMSQIAHETSTGSRSFDNVSVGNESYHSKSGFKTDFNQSYKAGAHEMQQSDGSLMKATQDGNIFSVSGAGVNKMAAGYKFDLNSSMQKQVSEAYNDQLSYTSGLQSSLSKSEAKTIQEAVNVFENLDKHRSALESYASETGSSDAKNMSKMVNEYHNATFDKNYSKEEAVSLVTSTHAGGGIDLGVVKLGASVSANATSGASTRDSFNDSRGVGANNSVNQNLEIIHRATSSQAFNEATNMSEGVAKSFNESYTKTQEYRHQEHQARDQLTSLAKTQQKIESGGANSNRDVTDEVTRQVASNMHIGYHHAREALESGDRQAWGFADQATERLASEALHKEYHVPRQQDFADASQQNFDLKSNSYASNLAGKTSNQEALQRAENLGLSAQEQAMNTKEYQVKFHATEQSNDFEKAIGLEQRRINQEQSKFNSRAEKNNDSSLAVSRGVKPPGLEKFKKD